MKIRIKSLLLLLFACLMLLCVHAATIVSPALNILAKENKMIKSGLVYNDICFSELDFMQCLGVTEIGAVKVEELPIATDGVLKLGTLHVTEGQTIQKEYLSMLRFVPASEQVKDASMTFSCGGTSVPCNVRYLEAVNLAPVFAMQEDGMQTYSNVSCYGTVHASDPEGDKTQLQIVSYPEHGVLSVTDPARGNFTYTPSAGFVGADSFVVVARDEYGNYSAPRTVSVQVSKTGISFEDTVGHWCENAAICLYEMGAVEVGNYRNGQMFCPDESVSREEFVAMTMRALCIGTLTDAKSSFADDDAIDVRFRPYVATAQRMGYIQGRDVDGNVYFDPKATITKAEAAVVINNVLGAEESEYISVFADDGAIPAWAKTAVYALTSAGVFNGNGEGAISPSAILSRAQTVQMLYNAIK